MACFGAESRTWTSTDGRALEAELVRVEGESVVVRRTADWRVFTIPLASLSEADRTYIAGLGEGASAENSTAQTPSGPSSFPKDGLVWPDKVSSPGNFEVEILEENNDSGVYRYRAGHFAYTSDVKLARKVVAEFAEVFEATYAAVRATPLNWRIEAPKDGYSVRLFSTREDYEAAGGIPGSGGTYNGRFILVPMSSLGLKKSSTGVTLDSESDQTTLIHEIVHQVQHDWIARMPVWLTEGFAVYIESVPYKRGTFDFGDLEPLEGLRKRSNALDEYAMLDLDKLMTMSGQEWNGSFGGNGMTLSRQYASAFLLTYYFAHLDGEGDGRRLWDALRATEDIRSMQDWQTAQDTFRKTLLAGRTYSELFADMQRAYRSEGVKLVGAM